MSLKIGDIVRYKHQPIKFPIYDIYTIIKIDNYDSYNMPHTVNIGYAHLKNKNNTIVYVRKNKLNQEYACLTPEEMIEYL